MNRNLVIGGVVAAVLHGGALLVFPRGPVPPVPEPEYLIKPEPFPYPPDVEPPETLVKDGGGAKKSESIPPPPSSDELLVKDPGPFITERTTPRFEPSRDPKLSTVRVDLAPAGTGDDGAGIFAGFDLDNPPRTRTQVPPVYPREARSAKLDGEVVVEFTVDEAGRVLNPRVVRSSDRVFEDATLRAVAKWRFEPGRRLGQIVRFRMAVPVVFSLGR